MPTSLTNNRLFIENELIRVDYINCMNRAGIGMMITLCDKREMVVTKGCK